MAEPANLKQLLLDLLNIPSPTYKEQEVNSWIQNWIKQRVPNNQLVESSDSFICSYDDGETKPHIILVGHTDTVPEFFPARIEEGRIHGSGASDMKGSLPGFFEIYQAAANGKRSKYRVSLVVYAREENTTLEENGLYSLIRDFPEFFNTVDLAIVGEPTDRSIQIGCVGSIHAEATILGKAAHSARPWNGENALYKAVDFIRYFKEKQVETHNIFGVEFKDVMSITTSNSVTPSRTTIPGAWKCNINYRFAPNKTLLEAENYLNTCLVEAGASPENCEIVSSVFAGRIVESPLLDEVVKGIGLPLQGKQAWTDVAQLGEIGIPAFNYGPGLGAQCHVPDEYILEDDFYDYYGRLNKLFYES